MQFTFLATFSVIQSLPQRTWTQGWKCDKGNIHVIDYRDVLWVLDAILPCVPCRLARTCQGIQIALHHSYRILKKKMYIVRETGYEKYANRGICMLGILSVLGRCSVLGMFCEILLKWCRSLNREKKKKLMWPWEFQSNACYLVLIRKSKTNVKCIDGVG